MAAALKKPEPDTPPATVPYSSIKLRGWVRRSKSPLTKCRILSQLDSSWTQMHRLHLPQSRQKLSCMKKCQGITGYNEWVPGQTLGDLIEP
jgi:hypothetical protein